MSKPLGDQSRLCGGGDCTLDMKGAAVMDGEHAFMPNGNERSMQWAALYSSPSPSPSTFLRFLGGSGKFKSFIEINQALIQFKLRVGHINLGGSK